VISDQVYPLNFADFRGRRDHQVKHTGTVRPSIDVVTKIDQRRVPYRPRIQICRNLVMDLDKAIYPAMNVTNGIDALAFTDARECGLELDQGLPPK